MRNSFSRDGIGNSSNRDSRNQYHVTFDDGDGDDEEVVYAEFEDAAQSSDSSRPRKPYQRQSMQFASSNDFSHALLLSDSSLFPNFNSSNNPLATPKNAVPFDWDFNFEDIANNEDEQKQTIKSNSSSNELSGSSSSSDHRPQDSSLMSAQESTILHRKSDDKVIQPELIKVVTSLTSKSFHDNQSKEVPSRKAPSNLNNQHLDHNTNGQLSDNQSEDDDDYSPPRKSFRTNKTPKQSKVDSSKKSIGGDGSSFKTPVLKSASKSAISNAIEDRPKHWGTNVSKSARKPKSTVDSNASKSRRQSFPPVSGHPTFSQPFLGTASQRYPTHGSAAKKSSQEVSFKPSWISSKVSDTYSNRANEIIEEPSFESPQRVRFQRDDGSSDLHQAVNHRGAAVLQMETPSNIHLGQREQIVHQLATPSFVLSSGGGSGRKGGKLPKPKINSIRGRYMRIQKRASSDPAALSILPMIAKDIREIKDDNENNLAANIRYCLLPVDPLSSVSYYDFHDPRNRADCWVDLKIRSLESEDLIFTKFVVSIESFHQSTKQPTYCPPTGDIDLPDVDRELFSTDVHGTSEVPVETNAGADIVEPALQHNNFNVTSIAQLVIRNETITLIRQRFQNSTETLPAAALHIPLLQAGHVWRFYSPICLGDSSSSAAAEIRELLPTTNLQMIVCSRLCEPIYI